jgi:hypothetical protein
MITVTQEVLQKFAFCFEQIAQPVSPSIFSVLRSLVQRGSKGVYNLQDQPH